MAISQISSSNTFAQWLAATQSLIDKQNYVEGNVNTIIAIAQSTTNTYNNTVSVYNNTVSVYTDTGNVYSNTVLVFNDTSNTYNNTVNVYLDIQSYVSTAYDTANNANDVANFANTTAYQALDIAIQANNIVNNVDVVAVSLTANAAYAKANSASNTAVAAYNTANSATNTAVAAYTTANAAFDKANTFSQNTFVKITVSGQDDIDATSNSSVLSFAAGANVTITTDSGTNTVTIDSVGGSTATGDVNPTPNTVVQRDGSGDAYANNFISSSDARLKENITPIENAIDIVEQLNGVHFTWKGTGSQQIGLIAQEVEKVLPEIVYGNELKSLNYPVLVSVLIEAIKELNERVSNLENK
jgi:hypothetical protein